MRQTARCRLRPAKLVAGMLALGLVLGIPGARADDHYGRDHGRDPGRDATKRGEVIQADRDRLVIRTEDGEQLTVHTDRETRVMLDGREVDLDEIDRGTTVQVSVRQVAQRIQAQRDRRDFREDRYDERYRDERQQVFRDDRERYPQRDLDRDDQQRTLRGEVIRAEDEQLVIRTEDGRQQTLRADERRTDVRIDGREGDLEDLERGMTVSIQLDRQGRTAERIQAQRDRRDRRDQGRDRLDRQRVFREDQDRYRERDDQQRTLRGEVIRAEDEQLVIRTEDGRQQTLRADERRTDVRIDGREGDLEDLERGMTVSIQLDRQGRTAERIQARRDRRDQDRDSRLFDR